MELSKVPSVAVLLAAYEGMPWIKEQVASILSQQQVEVTLFISVDPSTDGTLAWLKQQAQQDERIQLLNPSRSGGASQNFFRLICDIEAQPFDAFSLADQDDIWQADKLNSAWQQMAKQQVAAYSGNVTSFWTSGKRKLIVKSYPQTCCDYLFESAGPGCTFVLTKALFIELQAFVRAEREALRSVYFHDWFIYAFTRSRGYRWFIDKRPFMWYRQHDNNVQGANVGLKQMYRRVWSILKGDWYRQVYSICQLLSAHDDNAKALVANLQQGRRGLLGIACHVADYRRRPRDQYLLAIITLALMVPGFSLSANK